MKYFVLMFICVKVFNSCIVNASKNYGPKSNYIYRGCNPCIPFQNMFATLHSEYKLEETWMIIHNGQTCYEKIYA